MAHGIVRSAFFGFVFGLLVVLAGPASVQAQSYGGGGGSPAAANEIRLQQLETQIRSLTGQIEEQNHKIQSLEEELQRQTDDMMLRIRDLEARSGGGAVRDDMSSTSSSTPDYAPPASEDTYDYGGGSQSVTGESAPSQPFQYRPPARGDSGAGSSLGTMDSSGKASDSAAADYERAFSLLKESKFDQAEVEFSRFMKTYPDHILYSNALYWYGETFYVRGNYDKAARTFAEGYKNYPKGSKAADNLLKLGMSLSGLGKNDDACVALRQLQDEYSKAAGPVLRRGKQEMNRLGC
ncbi:MAG: tol-pal system protein YbgF [Alphaproteobacteria bacterium]|nr:tol-pal system protein YbgF [Alphaproteobacteria bacterium]